MESAGVGLARADVDRAGQVPAVIGAVAAGIEIDAVEQLLVDDRGTAEEVVQDGDPLPVQVDARVGGRRAANEELSTQEGSAVHPGQVLHHADGIVERARHVDQLVVLERAAGGGVLGARAFHHG